MKKYVLLGFCLATLGGIGCGDDDDDDDNGGTGGTGGGSSVTCTPGGDGACENETDCPKVVSGEARESAQICGVSCLESDDQGTCTVGCIVGDVQITQACAVCYATLVGCAAQYCLGTCGADPAGAECVQCQIDSGCRDGFDACSGLETAS
jgi:hypothetical protein